MESKDKTKIKLGLIGVAAAVILAGIVVGAVFVRKYSPSKKYMDGYEYFNVDKKELQTEFLSDQIAYKILDEEADIEILKVAEEKVKYLKTVNNGK